MLLNRILTIMQNLTSELILKHLDKVKTPGLFYGKMGIALFYYKLSQQLGDIKYEETADTLIDEIFATLQKVALQPDFENGLAGIGWGIEFLVQNRFLDANTDDVLSDIDDKIFQHIIQTEELPVTFNMGLLGYATYLIYRLKNKNTSKDVRILLESLLIEIINRIAIAIDKETVRVVEPPIFFITWELPLLLITLSEVLKLNIYNSKIYRILEEIKPGATTLIPSLHSNRVYMLLGIKTIIDTVTLPEQWTHHAELLKNSIDSDTILKKEIANKNISLSKGLTGLSLIVAKVSSLYPDSNIKLVKDEWKNRLQNSLIWSKLKDDEKVSPSTIGLFNGLAGIGYSTILNL